MGFDLHNDAAGAYFRANITGWDYLLDLAIEHGWEPEGTTLPGHDDWCRSYMFNGQQIVSALDASNIADAIDRAVESGAAWKHADFAREFAAFCRKGRFAIW